MRFAGIKRPIPVCADESVHDRASLDALAGKYEAINVKLDKSGGLTEALALAAEAERRGFSIMVGCMVATSLAMAPAMLVAQRARVVDLDGPLLLAKDRERGLRYEGSLIYPPRPRAVGMSGIELRDGRQFAAPDCGFRACGVQLFHWNRDGQKSSAFYSVSRIAARSAIRCHLR